MSFSFVDDVLVHTVDHDMTPVVPEHITMMPQRGAHHFGCARMCEHNIIYSGT